MSYRHCLALVRERWRSALVRERWRSALVTALLVMGATAVAISLERPVYEASASILVRTGTSMAASERSEAADYTRKQLTTYTDLVTTPLVLDPVIASLDLDTDVEGLAERISADAPESTLLLTISVRSPTPEGAAELANAVAESLRTQVTGLEEASGPAAIHLTTVSSAVAPEHPARPNIPRDVALGALGALVAGGAVALFRGMSDDTIRGPEDLVPLSELPMLATVPEHRRTGDELPTHSLLEPRGPHAEAHRELRTNLRCLETRSRLRSVLVTSSVHGEGKSTTAFTLAGTLAHEGQRVLLVEADLRSPSLGRRVGLTGRPGLTTALLDGVAAEDLVQPLGTTSLSILASGPLPPNPGPLLDSRRMSLLLKAATARYDTVVVDAPPVLALSDSTALAQQVSGTLLVVGSGRVRRAQVSRALRRLRLVEAPMLGTVLTRVPRLDPETRSLWSSPEEHGAPWASEDVFAAVTAGGAVRPSLRRRWLAGSSTLEAGSPSVAHDSNTRKWTP
ncbi:polysaccharide biosynthesis tyrosine autokinase [Brachybacterium tyrofermentans]|uniref:polysaccharide biosynthesis tyrosine autokinase n=1 Tax=Brachybacterium tyrofermentans TaxID=47848 RepID=UPI003F935BE1